MPKVARLSQTSSVSPGGFESSRWWIRVIPTYPAPHVTRKGLKIQIFIHNMEGTLLNEEAMSRGKLALIGVVATGLQSESLRETTPHPREASYP